MLHTFVCNPSELMLCKATFGGIPLPDFLIHTPIFLNIFFAKTFTLRQTAWRVFVNISVIMVDFCEPIAVYNCLQQKADFPCCKHMVVVMLGQTLNIHNDMGLCMYVLFIWVWVHPLHVCADWVRRRQGKMLNWTAERTRTYQQINTNGYRW